ncbi:MAG: hypothetical protein H6868_05265 [Rhodospirillales bacterium]|nr:hypothetical protein [Rhodospirillales bacterium]
MIRQNTAPVTANDQTTALPRDPMQAAQQMLMLTEKLACLMDEENRALVSNDSIAFMAVQSEKELATIRYDAAATEFHAKAKNFKGRLTPDIINRLEKAQTELGRIARLNYNQMYKNDNREV